METRETMCNHPPEAALEEYALGRVNGPELARIEEHLLVCARCQDALTETDEFVAVMKQAAGALEKVAPIESPRRPRRKWSDWPGLRFHLVSVGALGAAVLAVAVWMPRPPSAAYEAEATLQTMRGAETVPVVPAGKQFLLKADLTEVPVTSAYRLEIAASDGALVWRGTAPRTGSALAVVVGKKLRAGRYWVRLSDDSGSLLREYALESR